SVAAAAVNVLAGGRVSIDSNQALQGVWTNAGRIDVVNDAAIDVGGPTANLVNIGSITLSGNNAFALNGSTSVPNLTNNGDIVKTSTAPQQITAMTSGPNARLVVDAGRLTLDSSTLAGQATVGQTAELVLDASKLAGGVAITGTGTLQIAGNLDLMGDVTLGANAPTLTNDTSRLFTFVRGAGYKLTTQNLVNIGSTFILDGGMVWDNFGTVTVGSAQQGALAFNTDAVFNNKLGGVVDVKDGSRLELSTTTVINNQAGALLQVDSTGTSAFSGGYQGQLLNAGTVVKTGAGTTPAPLTNLAGGVLKINAGAFGVVFSAANANAGSVQIASGATLQSTGAVDLHNAGMIRGTGTVELGGAALVNNGVVAPGGFEQVGTLAISGNYTQGPLGTLNIRLTDATADALNVSGAVQLAGAVNLSTLSGGLPTNGASAGFLIAGAGRTGAFSQVNATPVVTPDTTGTLSVVYPASGNTVAQVKATTAATAPVVVVPPVAEPPVVVPPVVEPPVVEPPVVVPPVVPPPVVVPPVVQPPAVTPPVAETPVVIPPVVTPPVVPPPVAAPAAPLPDICSIAPHSTLCIVLSPPTAADPVKPVQAAAFEVIKAVTSNVYTSLGAETTKDIALTVSQKVAGTTDATGTQNAAAKKMYCN
ncbi:MAG: hypothetical protein JWP29_1237, partial [Rhodoferax sp.]|nr:hypothetical protein [Rhodoferax sp.]